MEKVKFFIKGTVIWALSMILFYWMRYESLLTDWPYTVCMAVVTIPCIVIEGVIFYAKLTGKKCHKPIDISKEGWEELKKLYETQND